LKKAVRRANEGYGVEESDAYAAVPASEKLREHITTARELSQRDRTAAKPRIGEVSDMSALANCGRGRNKTVMSESGPQRTSATS